ncbi:DUF4190 domain-containing protein [Phytohabitans sp. LJ34]|uniref:DUF4190 domain-containing protein n=1 Tax=Phytohabitans sp. LJ34 TaxID=3452217 RepID=UPI003F8C0DF7
MTQPPPYGSPQSYPTSGAPQQPYPTSGAPQQPDPWGQQQPASWGQQPQQPGVYGQPQSGVYGQAQQQPGVYGQPQPGVYGQPQQDQWSQQPQADQWGQQPPRQDQWGQQPQADQWGQQPPPGQWGQQQPPPPPRQGGTNGFAIASLVFGLLGGILLSVIFGFVALSQIKKRGQGGRGLAIAGLSLSGVWVLGIVALVIVGIVAGGTGNTNDPTTSLADSGDVNVQRLTPGQCLNGLKEGSAIRDLPAVPCTQPHEGEVFATFDLADGDFPGDTEVGKLAEDGCVDRLKTYSAKAADDPNVEIYFLHPTQTSWRLGDQGVACVAMSSTGKVTGSIKD